MNISILILSAAGFAVACYAYITERRVQSNTLYKPACDINDRISCTKALTSQYSRFFGVSTAVWGMVFYVLIAGATFLNAHTAVFILSIAGLGGTGFLAYLLYTKIQSFCLVCTTIYLINIGLFLANYL